MQVKQLHLLILLAAFLCPPILSGQTAYKFIEPNISMSYDSSLYQIGARYSNSFYGTEAYDFQYRGDSLKRLKIHVAAGKPFNFPPLGMRDSLILAALHRIKNNPTDTFSLVAIDGKVRHINNFSCAGVSAFDKVNSRYATSIHCYHFSENDYTEIRLTSSGKNLEEEYMLIDSFLKGFRSWPEKDMEMEEELVKTKYTVLVVPSPAIEDPFKFRQKTFIGIVTIKEALTHRIAEVRLNGSPGQEIFTPGEDGKTYIMSNDYEKGSIVKTGEVILVNAYGKKLKLPFSFTYENKVPGDR